MAAPSECSQAPKEFAPSFLLVAGGFQEHRKGSSNHNGDRMTRVSSDAAALALQMGMVSVARDLFERCRDSDFLRRQTHDALESMLRMAESVETKYGSGALLDLNHPMVNFLLERGRLGPDMAEAAKQFLTSELATFPLDEFVPGLTRHQARRLRR